MLPGQLLLQHEDACCGGATVLAELRRQHGTCSCWQPAGGSTVQHSSTVHDPAQAALPGHGVPRRPCSAVLLCSVVLLHLLPGRTLQGYRALPCLLGAVALQHDLCQAAALQSVDMPHCCKAAVVPGTEMPTNAELVLQTAEMFCHLLPLPVELVGGMLSAQPPVNSVQCNIVELP